MSGHSKWASIKHQKAVTDAKRSNLFTKLANNISVAARSGGDPTMNFSLRLAIDKAKGANMPKDNIERAIRRGTGELGGAIISEDLFEIYGPAQTAILVETFSDNKNRTSAEIKAVLNKLGGKLASANAVSYLFDHKGEMKIGLGGQSADEIELKIIEAGAEDYEQIDTGYLVYCKPNELKQVSDALNSQGLKVESSELAWVPKETLVLDEEGSEKVVKLLESLDDLDDVKNVSSNLG
jgi:YebC/PmpR family DNA-binding regulatory protein